MSLTTSYLGLKLKSPIILASSGLTKNITGIKKAEESGVGAIVLKSLMEEQINNEYNNAVYSNEDYPEALDYIKNYSRHNSLNDYLNLIKEAKTKCEIPIIASINCSSNSEWESFAEEIQKAGADALELNINIFPFDLLKTSLEIEKMYFDILERVKKITDIKIAFKMSKNFTNLANFVQQMSFRDVNSFVMFNKFYESDLDIHKLEIIPASVLSAESLNTEILRKIAILSGLLPDIEISASTSVYSSETAIKYILAGATTVQLCSLIYKRGLGEIPKMNEEISKWMQDNNFNSVNDFKAKLSYANVIDPSVYERYQFIKYFSSKE